MKTVTERCEGAFAGHAISSRYDGSVYMALNVANSLLERGEFDGPDIFFRHMDLCNKRNDLGQITTDVFNEARKYQSTRRTNVSQRFSFAQSTINELVQKVHTNCGGLTAGCGPVHRCYPLPFCPYITDDDLPKLSMDEAKLTHYSPIAGQTAAIVNVICRSLIRGKSWADAVNGAFTLPRLYDDIQSIPGTYTRWPELKEGTNPSYAPSALNTALHCVSQSKSVEAAVEIAKYQKNGFYCIPIAGILAGARWGLSDEMNKEHERSQGLRSIRDTANKLAKLWPSNPDAISS